MLYVRGDKNDYDNWAKAGNPGWSYEEILPYFKKSMDQQNLNLAKNTKVYARGGPLVVETPDYKSPLAFALLQGGYKLGYPIKDINDGNATGFSTVQYTVDEGRERDLLRV